MTSNRNLAEVRGSDAVKAALVEAAGELLAEIGPRALSVREVARRAGVNHGQVHHYFGSKRGLLEAAMRRLAENHHRHARALAGPEKLPPPLSLAEDPGYWRAICHAMMDGDLDLARVEVDAGVSVPRDALATLQRHRGTRPDDLDFRARFAAIVAMQLGWTALEDFVFLVADVKERDRGEVRERVKKIITELITKEAPWTSD